MMNEAQGTVFIISAASGTGKTSLAQALTQSVPNMQISISHTTRNMRPGEIPDSSYFYIDKLTFERLIRENVFLEYAKVYDDYYGTSHAWVEAQINAGIDIILDIDWQGAAQIRKQIPCVSIFILPPSLGELRKRLEARKRDSAEVIEKRLALAGAEISHYSEFDYVVINNEFDNALRDLEAIVCAQRLRLSAQRLRYANLLQQLQPMRN